MKSWREIPWGVRCPREEDTLVGEILWRGRYPAREGYTLGKEMPWEGRYTGK